MVIEPKRETPDRTEKPLRNAIEIYRGLGNLYFSIEMGERAGEGGFYGNLGKAYFSLGDFRKAVEYHEKHLKIAIEIGDRAGEGQAYGNLGNAFRSQGDFRKAIEYHEKHLKIAIEIGDRAGEGRANGNLGNAYFSLDYSSEKPLSIMKKP